MKKRVLAVLCMLAVIGTNPNFLPTVQTQAAEGKASGTTYYVSSINGDNANSGTSEREAWETLDMLLDLELFPGDSVLLEKGSVFDDGYIHLKDVHGAKDAPIRISSYGSGTKKPVINANGQGVWYQNYDRNLDNNQHRRMGYVSSAILLYDVDFVEVSDLEITNISDDFDYFKGAFSSVPEASSQSAGADNKRMDRTGVAGIAKDCGTMEHVYLDNLYIHDVDGNIGDKHMDNGGIQMNVSQPANEEETGIARYDDIRITNCYVRDVSRAGICVGYTYQWQKFTGSAISDETAQTYGHTNLLFENNYVKDIGNDGIVAMYAYRPLVQNNVLDRAGADMDVANGGYPGYYGYVCAGIWPWKCKDGIFQYNEAFDMVDNQDGMPWDIDYSDGTVYQYNYSHNNGGGCIMFCGGEAYNGTFRYNISQNDLKGLLVLSGNPKGEIYNNVFYISGDNSAQIHNGTFFDGTGVIRNNIFYNVSTDDKREKNIPFERHTYENNIFYGYDDRMTIPEGNLSADPLFENANSAPVDVLEGGALHDRTMVYNGYKLKANSPAINAGTFIEGSPKYDFYGNRIGVQPDIGVYESATPESVLELKAAYGASHIVGDGVISDVAKGITVEELKEQFIYAQDVTLKILKGGQEAQPKDVVTADMTIEISRSGAASKTYTLEIEKNYLKYDPAGMTASAGSVNSDVESAAKVLDGDKGTMWHSAYSGCAKADNWIELDLKESKPVAMVEYTSRTSGGLNGVFEDYEVWVRNSPTEEWKTAASGTWSNSAVGTVEYAKFDTVNARYVRLVCVKNRVAVGSEGKIFGAAAEIRIGYEAE